MTITFTPISNIKEVEVEGYGTVKIRPYGAGEELQIAKNLRELNELQNEANAFLERIKKEYDEKNENIPGEEKAKFDSIQKKAGQLSNELNELIKGTIMSDDPSVAKRLFDELPLTEIRRLIDTALKVEHAEA